MSAEATPRGEVQRYVYGWVLGWVLVLMLDWWEDRAARRRACRSMCRTVQAAGGLYTGSCPGCGGHHPAPREGTATRQP